MSSHRALVLALAFAVLASFRADESHAVEDPCLYPASPAVTEFGWQAGDPWDTGRAVGVNTTGCWLYLPNASWFFFDADGNAVHAVHGAAYPRLVAPGGLMAAWLFAEVEADYERVAVQFDSGSTVDGGRAPTADWPITISGERTFLVGAERWFEWTADTHGQCTPDGLTAQVITYDSNGDLLNVVPASSPGTCSVRTMQARIDFGPVAGVASWTVLVQGIHPGAGQPFFNSWDNYFQDIGNSRFIRNIWWLANEGITAGCASGRYCPDGRVTRAQMATFLSRALKLPPATRDYFTDDETSKHEANINRLREAGITSGCDEDRFCPDGLVTREQMASFLARAFALPPALKDYFTDDESSKHEANINRLAASRITSGCTKTTYCPKGAVTRGQIAAFLHRAMT